MLDAATAAGLPHVTHVATETSTLVWRLLDTSRIDQMEGRLVFIVIVSVLAASAELRSVFI